MDKYEYLDGYNSEITQTEHGYTIDKSKAANMDSTKINIPCVFKEIPQEELVATLRRLDARWKEKIENEVFKNN